MYASACAQRLVQRLPHLPLRPPHRQTQPQRRARHKTSPPVMSKKGYGSWVLTRKRAVKRWAIRRQKMLCAAVRKRACGRAVSATTQPSQPQPLHRQPQLRWLRLRPRTTQVSAWRGCAWVMCVPSSCPFDLRWDGSSRTRARIRLTHARGCRVAIRISAAQPRVF